MSSSNKKHRVKTVPTYREPHGHLPVLRDEYNHFEEVAGRRLARENVACAPGCSHCCRQIVFVTPIEGLLMRYELDRMRFSSSPRAVQQASLVERRVTEWISEFQSWLDREGLDISETIAVTGGATDDERERMWRTTNTVAFGFLSLHVACPVLDEGMCSLYPSRPACCRGYWSLDVNACRQMFDGGDPSTVIPRPAFEGRLRDGLAGEIALLGLRAGDTRGYILPLPFALADPWRWFTLWQREGPVEWAEAPESIDASWPKPGRARSARSSP